jgi:hypothetical protein
MTQTPRPIYHEDLGEILSIALTEVVAAVCPDSATADEKLELIAGRLLTWTDQMNDSATRSGLRSVAEMLIKSEGGAASR